MVPGDAYGMRLVRLDPHTLQQALEPDIYQKEIA